MRRQRCQKVACKAAVADGRLSVAAIWLPEKAVNRMKKFMLMLMIAVATGTLSAAPASARQSGDEALRETAARAVQAGVPQEDVDIIIRRGSERGLEAGSVQSLLDIAAEARELKLPLQPVLDRIEQGLAKGVPAERIAGAARRLSENLARAAPLVDGLIRGGVKHESAGDRDRAMEAVARALERPVPADIIARTGAKVGEGGGSVAVFDTAVRTMGNLMDRGMSAESASRLVNSAVEKGFTQKDLIRLEREVSDEIRKGRSADDVVKSSESEIRSGRDRGRDRGGGDRIRDRERDREKDREREGDRDRDRERDRERNRDREGDRSGRD